MSLPTAVALLALLVAIFAVLAVGAVYARLRLLERTTLNANSTRLADEPLLAPDAVHPRDGETAVLVLLLDATCAVCGTALDSIAEYVTTGRLPGLRVVAVFPAHDVGDSSRGFRVESLECAEGLECAVDPDMWAALYEGYVPCLFLINKAGRVVDRRFVYGDTELPALLAEILPTSSASSSVSTSGSNHAARPHPAH